jgi:hypothetical protein
MARHARNNDDGSLQTGCFSALLLATYRKGQAVKEGG